MVKRSSDRGMDCYYGSQTFPKEVGKVVGKDLVLNLMMATSNFFRGHVLMGLSRVAKFQLKCFQPFKAVVTQAEIEFLGWFLTDLDMKHLCDVAGGTCHNTAI